MEGCYGGGRREGDRGICDVWYIDDRKGYDFLGVCVYKLKI